MEAPAKPLELLLAKSIAVARGLRGVVAGSVGFDRQDESPGLVGVFGREVQAVAPDAVLADERYARLLQRVADVELERVELGCLGGLAVKRLAARFGIGKVQAQQIPAAPGAFGVHVGRCERRDRGHATPGASDRDVEPALAAFLIERSEAIDHLAVCPFAVANSEDDRVAFIALDALEVLDEEPLRLALVEELVEVRAVAQSVAQCTVYALGVGNSHGDH